MLQFMVATLAGMVLVGVFTSVFKWNFGQACLFQILYMIFGLVYFYLRKQEDENKKAKTD